MNYTLGTIVYAGILSALAFSLAGPIGIIFTWSAVLFIQVLKSKD